MLEVYSIVPNACICPFNRVWRERDKSFRYDAAKAALNVHFQFCTSWSVSVTVKTLQDPAGVRSGDLIAHILVEGVSAVKKLLQYSMFVFMY